jgi:hypothetical protein
MNKRKTFETFAEIGYQNATAEILKLLDQFTEDEAIAVLNCAKSKIALRQAWISKSNPLCQFGKQNGS